VRRYASDHAALQSFPVSNLVAGLPRPLYEDIERGRWLPVVGAGLSRNAQVPNGSPPPDWAGLAEQLRAELSDPDETSDAIDLISSYSQEHGRPALVERVAKAIRLADVRPAPIHTALCRLPIDVMLTTNFDTLLEDSFRALGKPCHAIIDEPQLALTNPFPGPALLKVHGDLSRPERMVLTEEDFDSFLTRNPLLATIVASHFAQRSVVLIGYSLSDPDLRQLLAMIRERLGEGARAIYSLEVNPPPAKVARFARRHVRAISTPGDPSRPGATLELLFDQLFRAIGENASTRLIPTTHESGLALRGLTPTRGCFLSATVDAQADYHEWLAPIASRLGAPLLSFQDFVSPGESVLAAVDTMLAASGCALVEYGSQWTSAELGMALNRLGPEKVLAVRAGTAPLPSNVAELKTLQKPRSVEEWAAFAASFELWLTTVLGLDPHQAELGDENYLVGSIIRLAAQVEFALGRRLRLPAPERTLGRLVSAAHKDGLINGEDQRLLNEFVSLRNSVAHGRPYGLSKRQLAILLNSVQAVLDRLQDLAPSPKST
jgi:hypothetical protein